MRTRFAVALALGVSVGACGAFEAASAGGADGADSGSVASDAGSSDGGCASSCPVAYWAFDEADEDPSVVDGSGNANDGVIGAVRRGPGVRGRALDFANQPGPVVVPYRPSLDVLEGTPLSITFWVWLVEPVASVTDQVILQRSWSAAFAAPYTQFGVEWDYNGSKDVHFFVGDQAASPQLASALAVPTGRWAHLAFVYDGTEMRGFLDGALTIIKPFTVPIAKCSGDFRFGSDVLGQQRFSGKLDEVRIFKGVLTADEITALAKR